MRIAHGLRIVLICSLLKGYSPGKGDTSVLKEMRKALHMKMEMLCDVEKGVVTEHPIPQSSKLHGASFTFGFNCTFECPIMVCGCLKQCFCLVIKICEYWRHGETHNAKNPKKTKARGLQEWTKRPQKGLEISEVTRQPSHHYFILRR